MKLYFDHEAFDGQLQRSIGKADSGMSNVGECLVIAEQVVPGDRDSWYTAWSGFAERLVERAREASNGRHRVSARGSYLRAAEYFRQAFFFHREDLRAKRLQSAYRASVEAFRSALGLLDEGVRVLSGDLSGYLFSPRGIPGPYPTILHIGGYDGTAEELYASVYPAVSRGYALRQLMGLARARFSTTISFQCDQIGRTSFPACSMPSPSCQRWTRHESSWLGGHLAASWHHELQRVSLGSQP